jgi:hypothetical protein
MVFRDVHIETVQCGKRIRLRPKQSIDRYGARVPQLWISGSKAIREQYPVGTTFIADLQLVRPERSGDYLKIRLGHELQFPQNKNIKRSLSGQLILF